MKSKKLATPTIGIPISSLYDPYQHDILSGIQNQATVQKVRILCFGGETFNHPSFFHISQNALYKLITPESVDALIIISGCLGFDITSEGKVDFLEECANIPTISIGSKLPGFPCIVIDNEIGMRNIVTHIVKIHGCKRIACITGPEDNDEAAIRFSAYRKSLEEYNIPFDPDLVCPGDFTEESGIEAVRLLVEERKISFDALIGVDDLSVLGAIHALKTRGFPIPDSIKVAGFDDMEESHSSSPPLTTVRQPLFELGNLAVQSILHLMKGKEIPSLQTIPTRVMIRRSCGCTPYENIAVTSLPRESSQKKEPSINQMAMKILSTITNSFFTDFSFPEPLLGKLESLVTTVLKSDTLPDIENRIQEILEDMVSCFSKRGLSVSLWEKIVTIIFKEIIENTNGFEKQTRIYTLWNKTLVDLYRIEAHMQTLERIYFEKETEKIQQIGDRLFTCYNLSQIKTVLKQFLPPLGIDECYISLYEEDKSKAIFVFNLGDKDDKTVHLAMFPSRNLVPKKITRLSDSSYCVLPLASESDQIGFVLFKFSTGNTKIFEALAEKISNALNVASLLEKIEQQNVALRESESEDLRNTLDSIGDAVIATDAAGKITKMNPEAEKLIGLTFMEVNRRPLKNILNIYNADTPYEAENPVETIIKNGHVSGLAKQIIFTAKDGSERKINYSGAPIRDAEKNIVGVVLVLRDVTEYFQMEERLLQAQKMDSVGQLAGGIAHDFNNMLAGITGAAELIAQNVHEDKEMAKYIDIILETTRNASDLTYKLLAFSQQSKIQSTPVNIHACIEDAVKILERSIDRRIAITMDLKADSSVLTGDPTQIQKIILDLGVNARDAMPNGGEIVIATTNIILDEKYCLESSFKLSPGTFIEITVRDTGTGMDKKTLAHIYEPFFTTKGVGKGTGLGLAAVYGIVREHHGCIHAFSELNKGTVFKVYLPVEKKTIETVEKISTPDSKSLSGCILVVDDEQIVCDTLGKLLAGLGFKVLIAKNGHEGIEIYKQNQNSIDLVILDIMMPKMDGYDTFKAMKVINTDVKILISSGFSRDADMDKLQENGAVGFLQKPYRHKELRQAIIRSLHIPEENVQRG